MADITFEKIVELVDHLTPQEQTELTTYLLEVARKRQLSAQEKMRLLRAAQIDINVIEEPSIRREDWYNADGR
jgi:hypothetical protein